MSQKGIIMLPQIRGGIMPGGGSKGEVSSCAAEEIREAC
jgi:hypothetical protein